jgi:hypothetical protein
MNRYRIEPRNLSPFGTADGVSFHANFYLGQVTLILTAQLWDNETAVGTPIPLNVSLDTLQSWAIQAAEYPERAGFLDFQIIRNWGFEQLGLTPIIET